MATMMSGTVGVDEYKPWWDGIFGNSSSIGGTIGGTGALAVGLGAILGGMAQNWTSEQKRKYLAEQLAEQAKNGDKKAQHLYEQMTGRQAIDLSQWIEQATGKRGVYENIWIGNNTATLNPHTGTLTGEQTANPHAETGQQTANQTLNPHVGTLTGEQTANPRPDVISRPIETPAHYVPGMEKMKWLLEVKNALDIGLRNPTDTGKATDNPALDPHIGTLTGEQTANPRPDVISRPIETPAHYVPGVKPQLLIQREGIDLGGLPKPIPIPKPIPVPPDPVPPDPPDPVPPVPDPVPVPDPIPPDPDPVPDPDPTPDPDPDEEEENENGGYISPYPDGGDSFIDFWGGNGNGNNENNENPEGEYDMESINWLKWLDEQQEKQWAREDAIRAETQAREDSAYQRAVKDMYKAGINPNLINIQPASAGGGITNATGKNTGVLEAQLSNDTKLLEQMIEQAFKGDENTKDRFTSVLGNLIQTIVAAMIFKG